MLVRLPPMQLGPPPTPPPLGPPPRIALCETLRPMRAPLPRRSRARRNKSEVLGRRLLLALGEPRRRQPTISEVEERRMLPELLSSATAVEDAAPPPPLPAIMYGDR